MRALFLGVLAVGLCLLLAGGVQAQAGDTYTQADYERLCENGDAESCLVHGQNLETALAEGADGWGVLQVYERGCRLGSGGACYRAGVLHQRGEIVSLHYAAARRAYERACSLDHARSCFAGAVMIRDGRGGSAIPAAAAAAFERGCDLGETDACLEGSRFFADTSSSEHDAVRARRLASLGCEGGDGASCQNYGRWSQEIDPQGAQGALVRAYEIYLSGCDARDGASCAQVGAMFYNAEGVGHSLLRSLEFFAISCMLQNRSGCESEPVVFGRILDLLERDCAGALEQCRTYYRQLQDVMRQRIPLYPDIQRRMQGLGRIACSGASAGQC